jgi:hypothetical protein
VRDRQFVVCAIFLHGDRLAIQYAPGCANRSASIAKNISAR